MAPKDYYLILGISRTESPHGIRKAFHDLAKRYHPDRVGPQGTAAFQEILEAYEILSEPERRRDYNRLLLRAEATAQRPAVPDPYAQAPEPLVSPSWSRQQWMRPEPLIPDPISLLHDFATLRPSFGALQDRLWRNFTGIGVPKSERLEALNVEVLLSPAEAAYGGSIRLGVPVFVACPSCAGTGRDWGFLCRQCHGQGSMEREETVEVSIPPRVQQGTTLEFPLHRLGIHNVYLRLHIRVTSWA
jgi:hypothetical protein